MDVSYILLRTDIFMSFLCQVWRSPPTLRQDGVPSLLGFIPWLQPKGTRVFYHLVASVYGQRGRVRRHWTVCQMAGREESPSNQKHCRRQHTHFAAEHSSDFVSMPYYGDRQSMGETKIRLWVGACRNPRMGRRSYVWHEHCRSGSDLLLAPCLYRLHLGVVPPAPSIFLQDQPRDRLPTIQGVTWPKAANGRTSWIQKHRWIPQLLDPVLVQLRAIANLLKESTILRNPLPSVRANLWCLFPSHSKDQPRWGQTICSVTTR